MTQLRPLQSAILAILADADDDCAAIDFAKRTGQDYELVRRELLSLVRQNYIEAYMVKGIRRYTITSKGLRTLRAKPAEPRCLANVAHPRTHGSGGPWKGMPWRPDHARPGCMDHVRIPSKQGSRLVYRPDAAESSH